MGFVAWPSVAVRVVRMAHAKKQRRKENQNFFGFVCGPEPHEIVIPLLPRAGVRGGGDEGAKSTAKRWMLPAALLS